MQSVCPTISFSMDAHQKHGPRPLIGGVSGTFPRLAHPDKFQTNRIPSEMVTITPSRFFLSGVIRASSTEADSTISSESPKWCPQKDHEQEEDHRV